MRHLFLLSFLWLLSASLAPLHAQSPLGPRLHFDFSWIAASYNGGEYYLDDPSVFREEIDPTQDFHFGLSYTLTPRLRVGLGYNRNFYRRKVSFVEADRVGTVLPDPNRNNESRAYSHSENWKAVKDQYLGIYLGLRVVDQPWLQLDTRLSFEHLFFQQRNYDIPNYQGAFIDSRVTTSSNYQPGVGLGADFRFPLNSMVSLRVSGQGIYAFGPVSPTGGRNYRYGNLSTGLGFQLGTQPDPPTEGLRKNTIMAAVGWPLALSYERLLYDGKIKHAARLFVDQYLWFGSIPGLAYNLKFGENRHYFLTEAVATFPENLQAGASIGYEYRGPRGFVLRLDGGLMGNQAGLGRRSYENRSPVYGRAQLHFGYTW